MKKLIIGLLVTLTGCTSNHYSPIPNSAGSEAGVQEATNTCEHDEVHKYLNSRDHSGAVAGGVLLGPLGAIVGDSMANQSPRPDLNVAIENCMAKKGYSGVSTGYN